MNIYIYIKSKSFDPVVVVLSENLLYIFNIDDIIDHK